MAGPGADPRTETARTNWAGNVEFSAVRRTRPRSVAALQEIVAAAANVRALGTGHSFSRIADTTGVLVSTGELPRTIEVDADRLQVEVAAGVRYGELGQELHRRGFALPNTGSLPHISVAGACATGTHGGGVGNQTLAASVSALTLVTPSGELLTVDRGAGDDFEGFVLSLGRLGVVVSLVVDVVPSFQIAQTVVENVENATVADGLAEILSAAYSVSIFTDWGSGARTQVWVKERVDGPGAWRGHPVWGGRAAEAELHPIDGMPPENTTAQLGDPGPWHQRLPHFRFEFMPSSGNELQTEYVLPLEHAGAAWRALSEIREVLEPVVQISEIRAVAADSMWLSMTGGVPSVAFHFTWLPDEAAVATRVAAVEKVLEPLGARPHWGKVFTTTPDTLARLYPRLPDFRRLVSDTDPTGKFGNDVVDRWIGLQLDGAAGDTAAIEG